MTQQERVRAAMEIMNVREISRRSNISYGRMHRFVRGKAELTADEIYKVRSVVDSAKF
jgi:hypothetical protein